MGIYKRKILRKKEGKHAFDQEKKSKIQEKKKENTLTSEKKLRNQNLDHAIDQKSKYQDLTFYIATSGHTIQFLKKWDYSTRAKKAIF